MNHETEKLILKSDSSLTEVLRSINELGTGFVFLGKDGKPSSLLTDGDIRRAILGGASLDRPALPHSNKEFVSAKTTDHPSKIAQLLTTFQIIPIIDEYGRLSSIASRDNPGQIPLYSPILGETELDNLRKCIETGWVSSGGPFVREFEEALKEYLQCTHVLTTSSGTAALELALRVFDIGIGDEVIVPNLTFVATANAVQSVGATPIFVDVTYRTGLIDLEAVFPAVTPKTKAIIAVNLYGKPVDVQSLKSRLPRGDILVIEDSAEAFGTSVMDKHIGQHSDASAFSFFGNKNITTGEGGALILHSMEYAEKAESIRGHGLTLGDRRSAKFFGTNFRMTNLQAAIGVAQMKRLPYILDRKREISRRYSEVFAQLENLILPEWVATESGADWLYTVGLDGYSSEQVESVVSALALQGIEARREFLPITHHPAYEAFAASTPNAIKRSRVFISLPSSPALKDSEIDSVAAAVLSQVERKASQEPCK